jgi:hypothetical protein
MSTRSIIPFLLFLVFFVHSSYAQTISGRINTTFYSWDRLDGSMTRPYDYNTISHFRGYQTVRLGVAYGDVSIRTYGQYSTDFNRSMDGDPRGRIYDLHLRWRNIFNVLDMSVGRFPVFAGAGRGTIDGGSLRVNLQDGRYTAYVYAGSLVRPFQSGRIQPWNDRRMVGGQFAVRPFQGLYASLSYMDRHNKRAPYIATRADSLFNPIQVLIDGDSREYQLASADISYSHRNQASVYGRFDYNLDDSRPQRAELWSRVTVSPTVALTAEYIYREPLIPLNSIFRMFEVESNQEIVGGIEYRYNDWLTVSGRAGGVLYDDESSMRYTIGGYSKYGSLSFSRTDGYAGEMNSLSVMAPYPVAAEHRWVVTAGGGYATYKTADAGSDAEWALSLIGGISHKVSRSFSLDFQAQYLTNRVFDYDTRVLFRVNYWFFENLGLL